MTGRFNLEAHKIEHRKSDLNVERKLKESNAFESVRALSALRDLPAVTMVDRLSRAYKFSSTRHEGF